MAEKGDADGLDGSCKRDLETSDSEGCDDDSRPVTFQDVYGILGPEGCAEIFGGNAFDDMFRVPPTTMGEVHADTMAPMTPPTNPASSSTAKEAKAEAAEKEGPPPAEPEKPPAPAKTVDSPAVAATTSAPSPGGDDNQEVEKKVPMIPVTPITNPASSSLVHVQSKELEVLTTAPQVQSHPTGEESAADSKKKRIYRLAKYQSGVIGVAWEGARQRWAVRWSEGGRTHRKLFPVKSFRASIYDEDEACKRALEAAIECRKNNHDKPEKRYTCEARGIEWSAGAYQVRVKNKRIGSFYPLNSSAKAHDFAFREAKAMRLSAEKELFEVRLGKS